MFITNNLAVLGLHRSLYLAQLANEYDSSLALKRRPDFRPVMVHFCRQNLDLRTSEPGLEPLNPQVSNIDAAATVPVPQAKVSLSTPRSYVRIRQRPAHWRTLPTKFTLAPAVRLGRSSAAAHGGRRRLARYRLPARRGAERRYRQSPFAARRPRAPRPAFGRSPWTRLKSISGSSAMNRAETTPASVANVKTDPSATPSSVASRALQSDAFPHSSARLPSRLK